jgi:hypothetical protein
MDHNTLYNFSSVLDCYTENYGKINLYIKNNIIYYNDIKYDKDMLNIKMPQINFHEILTKIQAQNKYIIHIINITYDPAINNNDSANYCKTLIIDNCGDIYSTITMYYDYKTPSVYPLKVNINSKKLECPKDQSLYPLPNTIIDSIKNINKSFIFKSIDYTNSITTIISNLKESSIYFYEFKQESLKNKEIIKEKDNMIINILDSEINDYKAKHNAHVISLNDIIKFLENENDVINKSLFELDEQNKLLRNKIQELELNNYKYKNNLCNKITNFYYSIFNIKFD